MKKKKKRKHIRDRTAIVLLGKRIKELRKEASLTQAQMAFEAKIEPRQVRRIERGEINTGVSTIFAIAKVLDVSVKELFNF